MVKLGKNIYAMHWQGDIEDEDAQVEEAERLSLEIAKMLIKTPLFAKRFKDAKDLASYMINVVGTAEYIIFEGFMNDMEYSDIARDVMIMMYKEENNWNEKID